MSYSIHGLTADQARDYAYAVSSWLSDRAELMEGGEDLREIARKAYHLAWYRSGAMLAPEGERLLQEAIDLAVGSLRDQGVEGIPEDLASWPMLP